MCATVGVALPSWLHADLEGIIVSLTIQLLVPAHLRMCSGCLARQHELLFHHDHRLALLELLGHNDLWFLLQRWIELLWLHHREGGRH